MPCGYLFDIISVKIKQRDSRALFGRQRPQGKIQALVLERRVGGRRADECPRLVDAFHCPTACLVVQEGVVGNFEEPRAKPPLVAVATRR